MRFKIFGLTKILNNGLSLNPIRLTLKRVKRVELSLTEFQQMVHADIRNDSLKRHFNMTKIAKFCKQSNVMFSRDKERYSRMNIKESKRQEL